MVGWTILQYEELSTLLCEFEATMNSWPLTYMYIVKESVKFIPLTPSSFLQNIQEIGIPDIEIINSQKQQKRHRKWQDLKEQLRNRFRKEYLASLVQKSKEKAQVIQTNDVVLVDLNNHKRLERSIGKVIRIFPSRDGCARVAEVRTCSGILVRAVWKLCPLEISSTDNIVIQMVSCTEPRTF